MQIKGASGMIALHYITLHYDSHLVYAKIHLKTVQ